MVAVAVAAASIVAGTTVATAASGDGRCGWLPSAIALAKSVAGSTDERAVAVQQRLDKLGITASSTVPASCGGGELPAGGTTVCEKFGSAPTPSGGYEVQNDVWGTDKPQCVRVFDTGFEVLDADFDNTDKPAAYPSIFTGCNHGTCTAGTTLPQAVNALPVVTSSWSVTIPDGQEKWNAAYDIWFDPTGNDEGENGTEMMIWLDHGDVAPIGEQTATVAIGGIEWAVWTGTNGAVKVISYVATTGRRSVADLPLNPFMGDAIDRGSLQASWYLTSIQAGFEPWTKGAGLATTSFSVTGVRK
jgi:hypothetical protein